MPDEFDLRLTDFKMRFLTLFLEFVCVNEDELQRHFETFVGRQFIFELE